MRFAILKRASLKPECIEDTVVRRNHLTVMVPVELIPDGDAIDECVFYASSSEEVAVDLSAEVVLPQLEDRHAIDNVSVVVEAFWEHGGPGFQHTKRIPRADGGGGEVPGWRHFMKV